MGFDVSLANGSATSVRFSGLNDNEQAFVIGQLNNRTCRPQTVNELLGVVGQLLKDNHANWSQVRAGALTGASIGATVGGIPLAVVGGVLGGPLGAGLGFGVGAIAGAGTGAAAGATYVIVSRYRAWVTVLHEKQLERQFYDEVFEPMLKGVRDHRLGKYICAITLEVPSRPAKTPCGHYFEPNELLSWLDEHTTCPSCNGGVSKESLTIDRQAMLDIETAAKKKLQQIIKRTSPDNPKSEEWLFFKEGVDALIADIKERINALDAEEATGLIQKHGRDEALKILREREAAKESQSQAQK
ncbi:MAG: hypothetical protein KDK65_06660, partial [Chlamydiia bacterium]|nr:hypothetical protein [Chlamydiia bacterium]